MTARMLMMSLSVLSREAAFEYGATPTVKAKLIFTRVDVPIKFGSRYGFDGTTATNGTLGASGTKSYTFAATLEMAVFNVPRTLTAIDEAVMPASLRYPKTCQEFPRRDLRVIVPFCKGSLGNQCLRFDRRQL